VQSTSGVSTVTHLAGTVNLELLALLCSVGSAAKSTATRRPVMRTSADTARQFGANLRCAREQANLTQEDLASTSGMDCSAISLLERGRRSPGLETILKLARALQLEPEVLLRHLE
jgi:DNA-binding XRE family transcriptional regulator